MQTIIQHIEHTEQLVSQMQEGIAMSQHSEQHQESEMFSSSFSSHFMSF